MNLPPPLPRASAPAETRWELVCARARSADGQFVYAVRTTGIYCRPSCRARRPLRDHVEFYGTPDLARAAGYRACLRCHPDRAGSAENELVSALCARLDEHPETSLTELAELAQKSPSHTHRQFRRITGLTPKQYAREVRASTLRSELSQGSPVTRAGFAAGYGSSGRLYASTLGALGMGPSRFRRGGEATTIHFACRATSLGQLLLACTERGVCAVTLGGARADLEHDLALRFPKADLRSADDALEQELALVVAFLESQVELPALPLDLSGSIFQKRVWNLLRRIPPGQTVTYSELATRLGQPTAARAVARACATNPVALLVPCHRVIRSSGELAGYRWGLSRKKALLEREAACSSSPESADGAASSVQEERAPRPPAPVKRKARGRP